MRSAAVLLAGSIEPKVPMPNGRCDSAWKTGNLKLLQSAPYL